MRRGAPGRGGTRPPLCTCDSASCPAGATRSQGFPQPPSGPKAPAPAAQGQRHRPAPTSRSEPHHSPRGSPEQATGPNEPDFSLEIESDSVTAVQTGPIGLKDPEGKARLTGVMRRGTALDSSAKSVPHEARAEPHGGLYTTTVVLQARELCGPATSPPTGCCHPGRMSWVIRVGALLLDDRRERVP